MQYLIYYLPVFSTICISFYFQIVFFFVLILVYFFVSLFFHFQISSGLTKHTCSPRKSRGRGRDTTTLGIAVKALALARLYLQEHEMDLEIKPSGPGGRGKPIRTSQSRDFSVTNSNQPVPTARFLVQFWRNDDIQGRGRVR